MYYSACSLTQHTHTHTHSHIHSIRVNEKLKSVVPPPCRFVIGREKPGEQSEVAQLIQQTLEQERWQREMMEQRYNQYMEEQEVGAHTHTHTQWIRTLRLRLQETKQRPN